MAMPAGSAMRTATLRDRKGVSDQVPVPAHVVLKDGTQAGSGSRLLLSALRCGLPSVGLDQQFGVLAPVQ